MNSRTKKLAPPRCQRQQWLRDVCQRLSVALMLVMLTTMTAWAQTTNVNLIKCGGNGGDDNVTATYGDPMPTITPPTRTGYTFGGYYDGMNGEGQQYYDANGYSVNKWNHEPTDFQLYAKWTANTYTITFLNEDGTEISSGAYDYGTAAADIVKPADPTKAADARYSYTFAGWDPAVVDVTGDAIYTATYSSTPVPYNITYVLYGGTNNENNPATYTCESEAITLAPPTAPANSGYTFDGWYTDANFENEVNGPAIPQNSTGNKTFYAKWLTTVTANVVWSDGNNTEGFRPESVTVKLMNGEEIGSVSLNASNSWSYTWTGLPTHKGGEAITYRVTEDPVANYSTQITKADGTFTYTVTNSRTVEETEATVNVVWVDANDELHNRPASVTATLLADGTATENTVTMNAENDWTATVTVQKYSNATAINYTWTITDEIDCYEQHEPQVVGTTTTLEMRLMTSGDCGQPGNENAVRWSYVIDSKTITIGGSGPMMYYNSVLNDDQSYSNGAPWKAFAGEIESVIIENGVTSVGSNTFAHCLHISSVTLPTSGIYEVGPGAFGDCTRLTSIDLPMSVNKIYDGAFAGCSNLKTVTLHYGDATNVVTIGKDVFPVTTTIIVPDAAYNAYMNAAIWNGTATGEDENKTDYTRLLAPAVITLAGNTSGWTTYCHKYSVSYSVEDGAAYTVSGINDSYVETATAQNVAPYTPTLVYKENGGNVTLTAIAETATQDVPTSGYNTSTGLVTKTETGFSMLGAATDAPVSNSITAGYSYALFDGEFLKIDDSTLAIPAHRCILTLPVPHEAPRLHININGEATSLSEAKEDSSLFTLHSSLSGWYTLDGRKLDKQPTVKGLYIHNGRKVVIK